MKKFLILLLFFVGFTAHSQSLRLLHPNGGEKFLAGEALLLQWETDDTTNLVEIEYSLDNGNSWRFLDTASGTSYLWKKLPISNLNKCLIKIQTVRKNNVQLVHTFRNHTSWVTGLSYNADGSKLASSSLDFSSKIWDVTSKNLLQNYTGHTAYVECVLYSNDGLNVLTGCDRGFIRKWNLDSNKVFEMRNGHSSGIRSLVFSPDNMTFASTGKQDNEIKIWDYATMKPIDTLKGHQYPVWCTAFSPDGKFLASSSIDQTVKIWDLDSSKVIMSLEGHTNTVSAVVYSTDGSLIISASMNGEIKVWESSTGNLLRSFSGGNDHIYSLALSPDNNTVAIGNGEYIVSFFDVNSGQLLKSFQGHEYYILKLLFNPTSNTLASSSSDRTIKIWNVDAPEIPTDKSDSTFSIYIDPTSVNSSSANDRWFSVIHHSENTYIQFENTPFDYGLTTITVFNALGSILEANTYSVHNGSKIEIDTKNYSTGQYFLRVESTTRTETATFVVVK